MSFITLMYHEIREGSAFDPNRPSPIDVKQAYDDILPAFLFVTLEQFEEQMDYLYKNNYTIITLNDVKDFYIKHKPLPEKSILLTFDDCYQSIKRYAYPILKKYGFPATAFVVTEWLQDNPKEFNPDQSVCLAEAELMELTEVFEYANHTASFHQRSDLTTSILMTSKEEDFEKDLISCNTKEYLNHKDVFAYPFGLYEERNISTLKNMGFLLAFTSEPGVNNANTNPLLLKRNAVPYLMDINAFQRMVN